MNYLAHRFSSLTSLVMLLVLTVGAAWLFSFATRVNAVAESWIADYGEMETQPIKKNAHKPVSSANVSGYSGKKY